MAVTIVEKKMTKYVIKTETYFSFQENNHNLYVIWIIWILISKNDLSKW